MKQLLLLLLLLIPTGTFGYLYLYKRDILYKHGIINKPNIKPAFSIDENNNKIPKKKSSSNPGIPKKPSKKYIDENKIIFMIEDIKLNGDELDVGNNSIFMDYDNYIIGVPDGNKIEKLVEIKLLYYEPNMNIKCDVKKDYRTKSYNKYNLYCMTNGSYEKIHIGEKNGIMVNMIDDKKVLMKNVNARIGNGVTQKKALFFRASSNDGGQYIIDNVYKIINLMSIMFFIKTDFFGEKFNVRRNVPSKCYIVKVGNNFGIYITSYETRNSKIKIGIETGNKNQEFELNISYSSMLMNDLTHIGIFISINSVVLYINGIKVNSQQFKLNRNMNNSDNSKISFGRDFKGLIEDFRLSLSNNLKSNIHGKPNIKMPPRKAAFQSFDG